MTAPVSLGVHRALRILRRVSPALAERAVRDIESKALRESDLEMLVLVAELMRNLRQGK